VHAVQYYEYIAKDGNIDRQKFSVHCGHVYKYNPGANLTINIDNAKVVLALNFKQFISYNIIHKIIKKHLL
jgi:hypothetical protein